MKKQVTLLKREKIHVGTFFNWDIATYMHPSPNPSAPKNIIGSLSNDDGDGNKNGKKQ